MCGNIFMRRCMYIRMLLHHCWFGVKWHDFLAMQNEKQQNILLSRPKNRKKRNNTHYICFKFVKREKRKCSISSCTPNKTSFQMQPQSFAFSYLKMSDKIMQLLIRQERLFDRAPFLSAELARSTLVREETCSGPLFDFCHQWCLLAVSCSGDRNWTGIIGFSSPCAPQAAGFQNAWEGFGWRSVGSAQLRGCLLNCWQDQLLTIHKSYLKRIWKPERNEQRSAMSKDKEAPWPRRLQQEMFSIPSLLPSHAYFQEA